jgi:hypothetical protein
MSIPQSRIATLSSTIAHHTHLVDAYLTSHALPQPSFAASGPADIHLPSEIEASRSAVLSATQELNDLLQGPHDLLWKHHQNQIVSMHLISHFDVARKIPRDGDMSFEELGKLIGVAEVPLKQILRVSIAHRVFCEPRPGYVAHSCASRVLVSDEAMRAWCKTRVEDMWVAAMRVVDALVKWPGAKETSQTVR